MWSTIQADFVSPFRVVHSRFRKDIAALSLPAVSTGCKPAAMARDLADPAPANMVDAQFSLPYAIAALAHRIVPAAAWYEAETLGRPDLVGFAARVRPEFDELIDAVFRETRRPAAAISIRTPGGTWRSPTIEHPLGSFERPMPAGGVEAKFLANVTPALGTRRARTSLEAILALASAPRAKDVLLSGMAPSGAR